MTPEGVLYEKETILECLLQQKKDIAKKLAVYEQQEQEDRHAVRIRPRRGVVRSLISTSPEVGFTPAFFTPRTHQRTTITRRSTPYRGYSLYPSPYPQADRAAAAGEQAKLLEFHRTNHGAGKYDVGGGAGEGDKGKGALAVQATEFAKKQLGEMKAFWCVFGHAQQNTKGPHGRAGEKRESRETRLRRLRPHTGVHACMRAL